MLAEVWHQYEEVRSMDWFRASHIPQGFKAVVSKIAVGSFIALCLTNFCEKSENEWLSFTCILLPHRQHLQLAAPIFQRTRQVEGDSNVDTHKVHGPGEDSRANDNEARRGWRWRICWIWRILAIPLPTIRDTSSVLSELRWRLGRASFRVLLIGDIQQPIANGSTSGSHIVPNGSIDSVASADEETPSHLSRYLIATKLVCYMYPLHSSTNTM